MTETHRLYFDHNASTPPDPLTVEQFVEFERRAQAAAQIEVALNWVHHLELDPR